MEPLLLLLVLRLLEGESCLCVCWVGVCLAMRSLRPLFASVGGLRGRGGGGGPLMPTRGDSAAPQPSCCGCSLGLPCSSCRWKTSYGFPIPSLPWTCSLLLGFALLLVAAAVYIHM